MHNYKGKFRICALSLLTKLWHLQKHHVKNLLVVMILMYEITKGEPMFLTVRPKAFRDTENLV
jgi:hypothetical protein